MKNDPIIGKQIRHHTQGVAETLQPEEFPRRGTTATMWVAYFATSDITYVVEKPSMKILDWSYGRGFYKDLADIERVEERTLAQRVGAFIGRLWAAGMAWGGSAVPPVADWDEDVADARALREGAKEKQRREDTQTQPQNSVKY